MTPVELFVYIVNSKLLEQSYQYFTVLTSFNNITQSANFINLTLFVTKIIVFVLKIPQKHLQ